MKHSPLRQPTRSRVRPMERLLHRWIAFVCVLSLSLLCFTSAACGPVICQNNATCVNEGWRKTCNCLTGWTGTLCDQDLDECASGPCQNKGECTQGTIGEISCSCLQVIHCSSVLLYTFRCSPANCVKHKRARVVCRPRASRHNVVR